MAILAPSARVEAQTPLTLAEAIDRAEAQNTGLRAADLAERQASERLTQARAARLPSVNLSESIQRGNQPVFVFGSLLAQRQFTPANFAVDALNSPGALNNVRVGLAFDQVLFEPSVGTRLRAAALERDVAATDRAVLSRDVAVLVTTAYGAVLAAEARVRAAQAAVESVPRPISSGRVSAAMRVW